ncbi:MAG: helix-turn-helix transcriptional regulator [Hydrogenoanaerobacterium sp.]
MIGTNIKMLRDIRSLSQVDLAERIKISPGTLSHIEKGSRQPSLDMLYRIADALNVSVINLVLDEKEIGRFLYDDIVKAYYPGSTKLKEIMDKLIENGMMWDNARRIAIIDLDDLGLQQGKKKTK